MIGFSFAAFDELFGEVRAVAPMQALARAILDAADKSVTLAIGLVGAMALFLGLIKIAEAGGLLRMLARLIRPLMTRLFPDVPAEHPAMGAMILNLSASALGLGNAATPFGGRTLTTTGLFAGVQILNPGESAPICRSRSPTNPA